VTGQKDRDALLERARVPEGRFVHFHPNGLRRLEGYLDGDRAVGRWRAWFSNGAPEADVGYRDGVRHGWCSVWHPNGQLFEAGAYEDGLLEGEWVRYASDGALLKRNTFRRGKKV
jgi:antitoxin component YwqK of YwqJK toxin-antitoxin module